MLQACASPSWAVWEAWSLPARRGQGGVRCALETQGTVGTELVRPPASYALVCLSGPIIMHAPVLVLFSQRVNPRGEGEDEDDETNYR